MKRLLDGILVMFVSAGLAGFAGACFGVDAGSWSYAGNTGPAKWAKLSKDFLLCEKGTMQSPIDIPDKDVRKGDLPALLFNYKPSPLRIVDDGHVIEVNYAPDSWVSVNGKRYQLVSIAFHKPGEHKVNGKGQEMEVQLVNKDKDGKLAIIAVPYKQGNENPVLKAIASNLPSTKGKELVLDTVSINALGLLPKDKGYYTFAGSLTTPPCTENVAWYIIKTPMEASGDQMARFARIYPMNARPTQPRNDRDMLGTP